MTKPSKFKLPVVVLLVLIKDGKALLLRRQNTGWGDGGYDLVAGHIDGHETLQEALTREAYEEANITINPADAKFMHLLHYVGDTEYMYIFFEVKKWQGVPKIMEPGKCDDMAWFPLTELPENLAPITRAVLEKRKDGVFYSSVAA